MARFGEWIEIKTRPLTEEEKADYCQEYEHYAYEEPMFIYDCELPNCEQEVLITTKGGYVEKTLFCDDCGCYFEQYEDEGDVVAWMPLPYKFVKNSKSGLPTIKEIKEEAYNQALEDCRKICGADTPHYTNCIGCPLAHFENDFNTTICKLEQLKK